jgi:hypothetical protein
LVIVGGGDAEAEAGAKTTQLTHAERVVLVAEQMHAAEVRAEPRDNLETQIRHAVLGDESFKAPRSRATCEWRLHAFERGRCSLQMEATGEWSEKAARVVLAEFNRYSATLCPEAIEEIKSLIHYARANQTCESKAGGYNLRVAVNQEKAGSEDGFWQVLIELWPQAL